MRNHRPTQTLSDYLVIAGLNSFACTLFILSLFFWTRTRFGFTDGQNLLLGVVQGAIYVFAARWGGSFSDRIGHDRCFGLGITGMALATLPGWMLPDPWGPYVMMAFFITSMGFTWPALQAAVIRVPGKLTIPRRLGIYNVIWSSTGAIGFFASGAIFRWNPDAVIWGAGLIFIAELAWIALRRGSGPEPGAPPPSLPPSPEQTHRKKRFLWGGLMANSLAFFMTGAFSTLAPHLGERLGLTESLAIWLASAQLFARSLSFVFFWKWEGWHYRASWSLIALWAGPVFLAGMFFAPSVGIVLACCILFGVVIGLSYYMSIYYALDYGPDKGAGGGMHESLIGFGFLAGPLSGALGIAVFHATEAAQTVIVVVAILLSLAATLKFRHLGTPA
ncbi:MAG: MFS transporter [Verrucomicrobia bacterium]|nr:MFS transporter [Verrucomicrobiota bacterium]